MLTVDLEIVTPLSVEDSMRYLSTRAVSTQCHKGLTPKVGPRTSLSSTHSALVIPKGMALWGSPKEIDFFLWGVLPKGDFESSFPKSTLLWGPNPLGSSLNARKGVQGNGGQ